MLYVYIAYKQLCAHSIQSFSLPNCIQSILTGRRECCCCAIGAGEDCLSIVCIMKCALCPRGVFRAAEMSEASAGLLQEDPELELCPPPWGGTGGEGTAQPWLHERYHGCHCPPAPGSGSDGEELWWQWALGGAGSCALVVGQTKVCSCFCSIAQGWSRLGAQGALTWAGVR